jgi:hypothetical protein
VTERAREYGYDVAAITREIQAQYMRDADGHFTSANLHPRALMSLVESLEVFTVELVDKARRDPGPAFKAWGHGTVLGSHDPADAREMAAWRQRLAGYRDALDACIAAPGMDELVACAMVPVTNPLLFGWYDNRETQSIPDFVTPFRLANMYGVSKDFADRTWDRFVADMADTWPVDAVGKAWDVMAEFSPVALLANIADSASKGELLGKVVVGVGLLGVGAYVFRRPLARMLRGPV